jgi:hypothetical protein
VLIEPPDGTRVEPVVLDFGRGPRALLKVTDGYGYHLGYFSLAQLSGVVDLATLREPAPRRRSSGTPVAPTPSPKKINPRSTSRQKPLRPSARSSDRICPPDRDDLRVGQVG